MQRFTYDDGPYNRATLPMHADDNRLGAHLALPASPVQRLLRQAGRLTVIQGMIRDWAREPLASSLSVANEREDVIVLHVASAAAHTQLRYRKQDLLHFLQERLEKPALRLEFKVRPSAQTRAQE